MTKLERELLKENIAKTMHQFPETTEEKLTQYKWYSKACNIHNEELTLELMKEVIKEGMFARVVHNKDLNRLEVRNYENIW